ncbi:MAG: metal ABC transporter permease [Deltaproteobacteria bacterium]|nr:metal ABC transporter permease [Deltaproteobacteria bacterium]
MNQDLYTLISLDLPGLLTAIFAAMSCGLLGNFLVLRKMSLMGDSISHSVLPGIVIAFLLTGSRSFVVVFIGAAVAGLVSVVLVELIQKLGRLESGAAMGVVFTVFFALGVLLIEQAAARSVDLDAECLLHGQLERIFWFPPQDWLKLFSWETLKILPYELLVSSAIFLLVAVFVCIFFKELKLSSFDPNLFDALGFKSNLMHYLLMTLVAASVVSSFEVVGSILVIAMIICPAAIARLLTDRLTVQIFLSVSIAASSSIIGYVLAAFSPFWVGWEHSLNAAGMMAVTLGAMLGMAVVGAPTYGLFASGLRRFRISVQVIREDMLGILYRLEELETGSCGNVGTKELLSAFGDGLTARLALRKAIDEKQLLRQGDDVRLSNAGRADARVLVRTHRLWESFMVEKMGVRPDHVHQTATELEHVTSKAMARELAKDQTHSSRDPHNRPIPEVDDE